MDIVRTDQRRFARQEGAVPAWLHFHEEDMPTRTITVNMGVEGAAFVLPRQIERGDPVMVRLRLEPDGQTLECKGKVCWTQAQTDGATRFGVRFLDLRDDERDVLGSFLNAP